MIEYCQFDAPHKDYVFTDNWVRFSIEELKKPNQLEKISLRGSTKTPA
jgi:hypothetical protein